MQTTQPTSKFIKELRFRLGMTQEQFAMELGVTMSSVQRWERGQSQPSPLAMKTIETLSQIDTKLN
jgi:putative transcriptional regulator